MNLQLLLLLARVEDFKMTLQTTHGTIDDATAQMTCTNLEIMTGGDGQNVVAREHEPSNAYSNA